MFIRLRADLVSSPNLLHVNTFLHEFVLLVWFQLHLRSKFRPQTSHISDWLVVISAKLKVFITKFIKASGSISSGSGSILLVSTGHWSYSWIVRVFRRSNAIWSVGNSTPICNLLIHINFLSIFLVAVIITLHVLFLLFVLIEPAHNFIIFLLLFSECGLEVNIILFFAIFFPFVSHLFKQLGSIGDVASIASVSQ